MEFIFIYVTTGSAAEAGKIARALLTKKLIACANFFPVSSLYWWERKIAERKEFVLVLKTVESNFEKVKKEIRKSHSYSIPCITKIKVEPNEEYARWLMGELGSS